MGTGPWDRRVRSLLQGWRKIGVIRPLAAKQRGAGSDGCRARSTGGRGVGTEHPWQTPTAGESPEPAPRGPATDRGAL